jgi:hypothetical protein
MKERPILFSGEMVRAILEGRKTRTRRVIKPGKYFRTQCKWYGPHPNGGWWGVDMPDGITPNQYGVLAGNEMGFPCPYGVQGDRLWVRETWRPCECQRCNANFSHGALPIHEAEYRSDGNDPHGWRPSIHMPRWASRITLEVVKVRVERVQEISLNDCESEGSGYCLNGNYEFSLKDEVPYHANFRRLWDSINAKRGYGWDVNPWVWVVEFKVIP